jgi:spore coat polysaccharide biosynthesis protein SpsF (cytidylyltransferase family)
MPTAAIVMAGYAGRVARVVAIVQARMGSSRLPAKSLVDIAGRPLLGRVLHRARAARSVDEVIVATTQLAGDDAIAAFANEEGVACVRGSEDDVLARFEQAADAARAEIVVRITADDPFKDPEVIDVVVSRLLGAGANYASNTLRPTYPLGIDIEAFTADSLARAAARTQDAYDREHVTPYLAAHPREFRLESVELDEDRSSVRMTIDHPEDLAFARAVYEALAPQVLFGFRAVLQVIESDPNVAALQAAAVAAAAAEVHSQP